MQPVPFERAPSTFCRELQNKFEAKKKDAETRKRSNKRALEAIQVRARARTCSCMQWVDPADVRRLTRAAHVWACL
jgi:hypothetical protein